MKIAIVGAHPVTLCDAPYDDASWRIWSSSPKNEGRLPRVDAWFEMHNEAAVESYGPDYLVWLRSQPLVYMQHERPDIPRAEEYPLDRVLDEFGAHFLTGTLSYMLALAILREPEAIGVWGIELCREYTQQRPSLAYFATVAEQRGIRVSAVNDLLKPRPIYGFDLEV